MLEARSSQSSKATVLCVAALARAGRDAEASRLHAAAIEAFHLLELFRAQGLLAMLAERDLVFDADLPHEVDRERRLVDATYEQLQAVLAELSPTADRDRVAELHHELDGSHPFYWAAFQLIGDWQ